MPGWQNVSLSHKGGSMGAKKRPHRRTAHPSLSMVSISPRPPKYPPCWSWPPPTCWRAGWGHQSVDVLPLYHDFNYRNRIDELRNDHDVIIHSMPFDHRSSAGRTTRFERYWLANREEATRWPSW